MSQESDIYRSIHVHYAYIIISDVLIKLFTMINYNITKTGNNLLNISRLPVTFWIQGTMRVANKAGKNDDLVAQRRARSWKAGFKVLKASLQDFKLLTGNSSYLRSHFASLDLEFSRQLCSTAERFLEAVLVKCNFQLVLFN